MEKASDYDARCKACNCLISVRSIEFRAIISHTVTAKYIEKVSKYLNSDSSTTTGRSRTF